MSRELVRRILTHGQHTRDIRRTAIFSWRFVSSRVQRERHRRSVLKDVSGVDSIRKSVSSETDRATVAMHIAGELVGRFLLERKAINCICLTSNAAVVTAWSNDYSYETVFARQVEAYGQRGGTLLGISTSGNSANVVRAFETARELGMNTIGLTGQGGGKMAALSTVLIDVPSKSTPIIQQLHITIYHYLCEQIEIRLAPAMDQLPAAKAG